MDFRRPISTIAPSLDGAALTVLAGADAWFTLADIVTLAGEGSPAGLRKVLHRLTSTGLVERREAGRVGQWHLNREHLAAEPLIALVTSRERLLERLGQHVAAWRTPPVLGLIFGSAARGQARLDSDLDLLLVVASPEEVQDEVADLERQATRLTGNVANALVHTPGALQGEGGDEFRWSLTGSTVQFYGDDRSFRRYVRGQVNA